LPQQLPQHLKQAFTAANRRTEPPKPRNNFPLSWHPSGSWGETDQGKALLLRVRCIRGRGEVSRREGVLASGTDSADTAGNALRMRPRRHGQSLPGERQGPCCEWRPLPSVVPRLQASGEDGAGPVRQDLGYCAMAIAAAGKSLGSVTVNRPRTSEWRAPPWRRNGQSAQTCDAENEGRGEPRLRGKNFIPRSVSDAGMSSFDTVNLILREVIDPGVLPLRTDV
jgi:hypothetical protein